MSYNIKEDTVKILCLLVSAAGLSSSMATAGIESLTPVRFTSRDTVIRGVNLDRKGCYLQLL